MTRCTSQALALWQHRLCCVPSSVRVGGRGPHGLGASGWRDAQGEALPKGGGPLRALPLSTPHTCGCTRYLIELQLLWVLGASVTWALGFGWREVGLWLSEPALVVVRGVMGRGGCLLLTVQCVAQATSCGGRRVPRVCVNLCLESDGRLPGFHCPSGVSRGTALLDVMAQECHVAPPFLAMWCCCASADSPVHPPWGQPSPPVLFALSHLRPPSSRAQMPLGGETKPPATSQLTPCTGGGHCGPSSPMCRWLAVAMCVKQEILQTACR